jgi:hypothetical protein
MHNTTQTRLSTSDALSVISDETAIHTLWQWKGSQCFYCFVHCTSQHLLECCVMPRNMPMAYP